LAPDANALYRGRDMQWVKLIVTISTGGVILGFPIGALGQTRLPQFEDYAVRNVFKGKPAAPRINFPKAHQFRTMLKEHGQGPPDFAGHYRIIDIGCGADCTFIFVVNVITGQVYYPGVKLNFSCLSLLEKEEGRALKQYHRPYRLDSRLLLSIGQSEKMGRGLFFYEWTGSRFRLIQKLVGKE
jgi:hypothetical protein